MREVYRKGDFKLIMISVELTEEDAELFKQFQKYYLFIKFLETAGAFKMKDGYMTISFLNTGEIQKFDLIEKSVRFNIPLNR